LSSPSSSLSPSHCRDPQQQQQLAQYAQDLCHEMLSASHGNANDNNDNNPVAEAAVVAAVLELGASLVANCSLAQLFYMLCALLDDLYSRSRDQDQERASGSSGGSSQLSSRCFAAALHKSTQALLPVLRYLSQCISAAAATAHHHHQYEYESSRSPCAAAADRTRLFAPVLDAVELVALKELFVAMSHTECVAFAAGGAATVAVGDGGIDTLRALYSCYKDILLFGADVATRCGSAGAEILLSVASPLIL
jgi:hypothetical protein